MAQSIKFEEIKNSCTNLQSLASKIKTINSNIDSVISKITSPTWAGDAANNFRDKLQNLSNKLPDAQHQMALSVLFLASCSDGYEILGENNVDKLIDLAGGQDYIDGIDYKSLPDVDFNEPVTTKTDITYTPPVNSTGVNYTGGVYNPTPSGGGYYVNPVYSTGAPSVSSSVTSEVTSEGTSEGTYTPSNLDEGTEIVIPDSVVQGPYTVTCYDYWYQSGTEMIWTPGTNQRALSDLWKQQGSKFKNGIAVINVDGVDRYLVAVTTTFGVPGDLIDVKLADGTVIPCIIGDSKGDGNATGSDWGHPFPNGSINILEFEVERAMAQANGNPTTEKWGLEWDSSQKVKSIVNLGNLFDENRKKTTSTSKAEAESVKEAREAIVSVAESEIGDAHSSEYLAMFGEGNTDLWCSEFVSWCAKKSGYVDAGIIPAFAGADEGAAWFQQHNQFQDRNYTPKAGDILFTGGSGAYHTGLVTGVKDGKVLTIEGGGDSVKKRSHTIGDSNIYGYGTPDYSKVVKEDNSSSTKE